ncbi:hypothetical protein VMCG_10312 [Cytospora schulzeri]|uniref:Uncharacterized protein n=1 Tax=Cytospora schulzeri TaxID=448051 RepID=A0A423VD08_9PEZI|nr:hypothetical protein VMCG_10312 [Valsa malicola]
MPPAPTNWTIVTITSPDHGGWVPSPNSRGTMGIIWPCLSTLGLCLWSMVHLNVPATRDTSLTIILRKLRWLLIGLLAPELVMMFAFAQRTSAEQSVADMAALGHRDWTRTHGFYADGGGFELLAAGCAQPFPLTAKQLAYLVQHGFVDMPKITRRQINDKSKADGLAKALAFVQAGWFGTQLVGRAAQGLGITPFELITSALVLCSFTSLGLWWEKPLDVQTPTRLHAKQDVSAILIQAGEAARTCWSETPLDFVESNTYWSSKLSKGVTRLILRWDMQKRPLDRIPNDRDYHPRSFKQNMYLAVPVSAFVTIHLLAWNISLPTAAEQFLWRINCIIMSLALHVHCVSEAVGFWWTGYAVGSLDLWGGYKKRLPWSLVFIGLAAVYSASRLCMLIEGVISLRDLPETAFRETTWSQFLPRIGS